MSERIPMGEDIRQALRGDGWTLDEADEGIERIKRRGIGIARIKAEAWDEGYAAGQTDDEFEATNPYREEAGL